MSATRRVITKKDFNQDNYLWLYGKHPVLMALLYQKRKIYQLLVSENAKQELEKFLAAKQLKINKSWVEIVESKRIDSLFPEQVVHQGFALKASFLPLVLENDFLSKISKLEKNSLPRILILDGLTDPHNIGAIIRSAVAFGVRTIMISERNSPKDTAIIAKSSSGMSEMVDLVLARNLNNLLLNLKKIGYWCIGLDTETKMTIAQVKDYQNIALISGSEGVGIKHLVKQNCDLLVKIPMSEDVESLNVSNAVAISLYELFARVQ